MSRSKSQKMIAFSQDLVALSMFLEDIAKANELAPARSSEL